LNPYTLIGALKDAEKNTHQVIEEVLLDQGYRGHVVKDKKIYMPSRYKKVTRHIKNKMDKRSRVEACIGTMKKMHKMSVNDLKGQEGDKANALLCAIGYNMMRLVQTFLWLMMLWCTVLKRPCMLTKTYKSIWKIITK